MKEILIFGSTGSIGKNALKVIASSPYEFNVRGLATHQDVKTLYHQIKQFKPKFVCVRDEAKAEQLEKAVSFGKKIKFFKGDSGLKEFAHLNSDISVMAVSGIACLEPLMINLGKAKTIALASKEPIVVAGDFVFKRAAECKTKIIPVDSEINALYQLFAARSESIAKVYLTASGGALYHHRLAALKRVSVSDVLNHPTWRMGQRITVDSATLVNKGFEVVETHHFFDLAYSDINVVIHRESLAHALVEYKDRSLFACVYPADMRIPLAFALNYPQRKPVVPGLDFRRKFVLSFAPLNYQQFPLLKLVLDAAVAGNNYLTVLNACDEVAVEYFIKGKIKYTDIIKTVKYICQKVKAEKFKNIADLFYWDNLTRVKTREYLK